MYNPFPLLTTSLLSEALQRGKRYFVRQSYRRGFVPGLKAAFLFRAYGSDEKLMAETHMATLNNDRNAFLYDARTDDHLRRLNIAATQPPGFRNFYAAKKGTAWKPPAQYQEKIRKFIALKHPAWRPKRGDKIEVGLFEEFGRLFLKFNFEDEEDKIPFEQIEE